MHMIQDSSDVRYLAARLMSTWGDTPEEQQLQYPALPNSMPDQASASQHLVLPTDEPSFNQWARSLRINPTGAVQNLMDAMQSMAVTNEQEDKSKMQQRNDVEV